MLQFDFVRVFGKAFKSPYLCQRFSEIETTFQISEIEEFGQQKYPKKFVYSVKSRIRMIRNDFQPCMHA